LYYGAMRRSLLCLIWVSAALLAASPARAHHSFESEYNSSRPVTISGKVTKLLWQNPHVLFYIDVENPKTGRSENWSVELGSVNSLTTLGWTQNSLKMGTMVTVQGIHAIAPVNKILPRNVMLTSTGQRLLTSSGESSLDEVPAQGR